MATTTKRAKIGGSTYTKRTTSKGSGVKRTTNKSTKCGNTRTTTNLGTGKTRKTKLW
jgi:hypothetical protein